MINNKRDKTIDNRWQKIDMPYIILNKYPKKSDYISFNKNNNHKYNEKESYGMLTYIDKRQALNIYNALYLSITSINNKNREDLCTKTLFTYKLLENKHIQEVLIKEGQERAIKSFLDEYDKLERDYYFHDERRKKSAIEDINRYMNVILKHLGISQKVDNKSKKIRIRDYYWEDTDYYEEQEDEEKETAKTIFVIAKIAHEIIRTKYKNIAKTKSLSPYDFEYLVGSLFKKMGYTSVVTKGSGDGGIDLLIEKQDNRYIIQCKKYEGTVSPSYIRELMGLLGSTSNINGAFLVTTGNFSQLSQNLANKNNITLIDGIYLDSLMGEYF